MERYSAFIIAKSKQILLTPYNPEYWFRRADTLLHLGYPELATGDARKACLLIESAIDDMGDDLGEKVKAAYSTFLQLEQYDEERNSLESDLWMTRVRDCLIELLRNTYRLSLKAIEFTLDPWEALHICQEAKHKYPNDDYFPEEFRVYKAQFEKARQTIRMERHTAAEANQQLIQGRIFLRQYPFIPAEYLRRSGSLITLIQTEFTAASPKCKLVRSPESNRPIRTSEPTDVLGIFASSDIAISEHLFADATVIGATNTLLTPNEPTCEACCGTISPDGKTKVLAKCCPAVYCSRQCQTRAMASYHEVLCGQDFGWLCEAAKPANDSSHPGLDGLVWLRVLSLCVQSDCHPLQHPLLARLTAQYKSPTVHRWSYEWNVDIPIQILRQLGVDVWVDHRFDTWVLQTIWARLINNRNVKMHHGRAVVAVNPLFSFFNHSCEPNATWRSSMETSTGGTTVEITATRPMRKDEEIFISYCDDGAKGKDLIKDRRQDLLMPWLGQKCECPRCERE